MTVRAGEAAVPLISVANRDPDVYPEPHRLDFTRTGPAPHLAFGCAPHLAFGCAPHLAFGHGPHYCLGAPLANLELQIALGSLLGRFPTLAPAADLAELEWKPGLAVRALRSLPVTW